MIRQTSWLSITPEPERELPQAVATMAAGGHATAAAIAAERARIERLVTHGSQRRWLDYLHGVVGLIERRASAGDPDVALARARAIAVVANHHNLLLALPGAGAKRTASERAGLQRLLDETPTRGSA